MKVALVVPGGVDRSGEYRIIPAVLALIRQLSSRGELRVFALRQDRTPARWTLCGAQVENIGRSPLVPRCVMRMARAHRDDPLDVIHAVFAGQCGLAAVLAARMLDACSVVHVAGGELSALRDISYGGALRLTNRLLHRQVLRSATFVTAASKAMLAQIAGLGVPGHQVPLGVDLEAWPACAPVRRAMAGPLRLIHVASLNRVKDQTTLLHAMAVLRDGGVDFHLDVVGEDTLGGEIQALAGTLGLGDRVRFHGFLTQRELYPLVVQAHVNLVSSLHEAGPVVVLEAAVAGVPTVGTAVGHVADWAPEAALAVRIGDPQGIAAAVAALARDESLRLGLAGNAHRMAVAQDSRFTADCFERLYRSARADRTA